MESICWARVAAACCTACLQSPVIQANGPCSCWLPRLVRRAGSLPQTIRGACIVGARCRIACFLQGSGLAIAQSKDALFVCAAKPVQIPCEQTKRVWRSCRWPCIHLCQLRLCLCSPGAAGDISLSARAASIADAGLRRPCKGLAWHGGFGGVGGPATPLPRADVPRPLVSSCWNDAAQSYLGFSAQQPPLQHGVEIARPSRAAQSCQKYADAMRSAPMSGFFSRYDS